MLCSTYCTYISGFYYYIYCSVLYGEPYVPFSNWGTARQDDCTDGAHTNTCTTQTRFVPDSFRRRLSRPGVSVALPFLPLRSLCSPLFRLSRLTHFTTFFSHLPACAHPLLDHILLGLLDQNYLGSHVSETVRDISCFSRLLLVSPQIPRSRTTVRSSNSLRRCCVLFHGDIRAG